MLTPKNRQPESKRRNPEDQKIVDESKDTEEVQADEKTSLLPQDPKPRTSERMIAISPLTPDDLDIDADPTARGLDLKVAESSLVSNGETEELESIWRKQAEEIKTEIFDKHESVEKIVSAAELATRTSEFQKDPNKPISTRTLTYLKAAAQDFKDLQQRVGTAAELELEYQKIKALVGNNLQDELAQLNELQQYLAVFLTSLKGKHDFVKDAENRSYLQRKLGTISNDNGLGILLQHLNQDAAEKKKNIELIVRIQDAYNKVTHKLKQLQSATQAVTEIEAEIKNTKVFRETNPNKIQYTGGETKLGHLTVNKFKYHTEQGLNTWIKKQINKQSTPSASSDSKSIDAVALRLTNALDHTSTDIKAKAGKAILEPGSQEQRIALITLKQKTKLTYISIGNEPSKIAADKKTIEKVQHTVSIKKLRSDYDREEIFLTAFNSLTPDQKNRFGFTPADTAADFFASYIGFPATTASLTSYIEERANQMQCSFDSGSKGFFTGKSISAIAGKLIESYKKQFMDPQNPDRPAKDFINICKLAHDAAIGSPLEISGNSPESKWTMKIYCEAMKVITKDPITGMSDKKYEYVDFENSTKLDIHSKANAKAIKSTVEYLIREFYPTKYNLLEPGEQRDTLEKYVTKHGKVQIENQIREEAAAMQNARDLSQQQLRAAYQPMPEEAPASPKASTPRFSGGLSLDETTDSHLPSPRGGDRKS